VVSSAGATVTSGIVVGRSVGATLAQAFGMAFVGPFLTAISVAVTGVLAHALLAIVRGPRAPLSHTLRASAYAQAPAILAVVPRSGALVAALGSLVVLAVMLSAVHRTGVARAAFAVIGGPLLCAGAAVMLRVGALEAFKIPSGSMVPSVMVG